MNTKSMTFSSRDLNDQVVPGHKYLFEWIKPHLNRRNISVLDIGCWTGPLEQLLYCTSAKVTGVDIDDEPIELARKKFPRYSFVKASVIDKLPFDDCSFDIVCFFMVIEHLLAGTEGEALKNIAKVLKPKGKLFMSTMLSNPLSNLMDPAYFITSHRHYSAEHLISLLDRAGFEVKEIYRNGGWFTTLHIWLLYFFKHILKRREPRGRLMDWLMENDYKNKGFCEIEILAIKKK